MKRISASEDRGGLSGFHELFGLWCRCVYGDIGTVKDGRAFAAGADEKVGAFPVEGDASGRTRAGP